MPDDGAHRAVFLDRDGTLIEEGEFLADPDRVRLLPGVPEALIRLRSAGFLLIVVTNQSGIARGILSEADYHAVAGRLDDILAAAGIRLDGTYYCPCHPDFTEGPCTCRKPATGMYESARRDLNVDLGASVYVGDRLSDVQPAITLGGRGFLVRTGYGSGVAAAPSGVTICADLGAVADAVDRILRPL